MNGLSLKEIKLALETAAFVERTMPPVRPPKVNSWLFDIVYSPQELALMAKRRPRITPTKEQIGLWELVVFDWFAILEPDERKLAWKRANHIPWKLLCREFGLERTEMWRRFHNVLIKIYSYIKGKNVGNKKA